MPELRRSGRTKSRSDRATSEGGGLQGVDTDDRVAIDQSDAGSASSGEESFSEEADNVEDDDYVESSTSKRKKRQAASQKKKPTSSKKPRSKNTGNTKGKPPALTVTEKEQHMYLELIQDFQPTELFEVLSTSEDVSVDDLLRDWLEEYSENRDTIIQQFINLLLNCCGCVAHLEEHDVHSNESSNETVSELQLAFQNQKLHEFYLLMSKNGRKNATYKPLYNNFVEFMSKLLDVASDLQLLTAEFDEDQNETVMGPFVLDLLTWLSSFSVSKIRCFRYVSTVTLYLFQDFLSEHVVDLEKNYLAKFTKQLGLEEKKKRPNKKTLEELQKNIAEVQGDKGVVENIIDNIVKLCFVHRFKDVDEFVRSESVIHLSVWIRNYPEYFMKVTFLKYFGWLLSDSSKVVRSQVLKVLPHIITSSQLAKFDNSATRQFFERFKQRILEIALNDVDLEVRLHATHVLVEVVKMGYLEDAETLAISSLIYDDSDIKVSSHSKNSRFLAAVAKFFSQVIKETSKEFMKSNNEIDENMSPLKTSNVVKIGIIVRFLSNSLLYYLQDTKEINSEAKVRLLFQASEFLSTYFGQEISNICMLLTDDDKFENIFKHLTAISKETEEKNNADDEEDPEETINITPLLPTDNNNVILYVTVLSGLCHGAMSLKNQQSQKCGDSILPHFLKLLKNLPIQSMDIFCPLLDIFGLFAFEDWIRSGHEKDVKEVVKIIDQAFLETNLASTDFSDSKFKSFSNVLQHIKGFNINDFDEIWINEVSHLEVHMGKFLEESEKPQNKLEFNEFVNTVFSVYLNKLVLLGKEYIIEFSQELLVLFFKQFFSTFAENYADLNEEILEEINFKLPILLVTWKLQKWADLLRISSDNSIDSGSSSPDNTFSHSAVKTLKYIGVIYDQLSQFLISLESSKTEINKTVFLLKWQLSSALIDIIVALKCFELQLPENETNWKASITERFPYYVSEEVAASFLDVFLCLESLYAKSTNVELDRASEEDVNLNDLTETLLVHDPERELLLYTIKMKGLIRLEFLNSDVVERLKLNKERLDPLFAAIIDGTIFESGPSGAADIEKKRGDLNKLHDPPVIRRSDSNETDSIVHGTFEIRDGTDPSDNSSLPSVTDFKSHPSGDNEELGVIQENSHELSSNPVDNEQSSDL
ncbi:cohesin subunit IRR1 KNAG_0L01240 [Huiozyma naganishii CBS 8797]|uniref:SCD domain-containing protein n=1 Tax=Huiozyma naganishii (strain ATCC MYA-139 / BCRC 22969 / CBS 8797 / KCTC 17520 / NBRC 10181 / NCYC 3082 / Yp74L-3) TaxID=1071383 RepID=J7SAH0_HUIN7|nr:hypothetical protein KNAG_0L01240 [Kazachstania naganishii CBS 8797]CCK72744.1 hypothetical protein KNAG_0L01240 [Kazachstania naganishii CBS 8797]